MEAASKGSEGLVWVERKAHVGPRLEQRVDAGSITVVSREVQRRILGLPRRGGGPTHTLVSGGGGAASGELLRRVRPPSSPRALTATAPLIPLPAFMRAGRLRADSRQRGGSAVRWQGAQRRQRGTARSRERKGSGAQPPLTPYPHNPRQHAAAGPRRTLSWTFRLAPLAMRYSRQSSLPLAAACMRAVSPPYGGTAAIRDQRRL